MANVHIREGYKDAAWFTANASLILKQGQRVNLLQTGTYKLGDGVTQLSALTFLGGGDTVDVNTIGAAINGATTATPNDTDLVMSVDTSVAKKNTWTQIKAFLKTYFDTVYTTTSAVTSQITTALSGYATQAYVLSQGYITNVITALGYTPENSANKTSTITGNETSTTLYTTVKGVYDWVTGLFVKKGTITNNTILKGSSTDTATNSQITDDGTTIEINSTNDGATTGIDNFSHKTTSGAFRSGYYGQTGYATTFDFYNNGTKNTTVNEFSGYYAVNTKNRFSIKNFTTGLAKLFVDMSTGYVGIGNDFTAPNERLEISNGKVRINDLTPSQIVATDASKNLQSLSTATYPSLTELSYVKGLTSHAQIQLDGKRSSTKEMLLATCFSAPINPADGITYYFGCHGAAVMTTLQSFNKFQFNENFTITRVIFEIKLTANPTNESVSFYLRSSATTDNTITTSMDMSLIGVNASRVYTYTPTISVTSGTDYEIKMVTPTWATNPGINGIVVKIYGY